MLATAPTHRVGPARTASATRALGALAACAVVSAVDPGTGGPYPRCPTRVLLGFDCPVCGTLRGLHALSRGHLAEAVDHNALLVVAVPVGLVMWIGWVATALGRPLPSRAAPGWIVPVVIVVAVAFTVARNSSAPAFAWLGSS